MAQSFLKKEIAQKKAKQKKDKAEKMRERKLNNDKGKSLEDMMVYLDEFGNFTSTPPDAGARTEIALEDIQLGAAPIDAENPQRKGVVSFFNDAKGYGFIVDIKTQENIFVHSNQLTEPIKERDRVTFEKEKGPRGMVAINVKKY